MAATGPTGVATAATVRRATTRTTVATTMTGNCRLVAAYQGDADDREKDRDA